MGELQLCCVFDVECFLELSLISSDLSLHLLFELMPDIRGDVRRNAFHIADAKIRVFDQRCQMLRKRCLVLELVKQYGLFLFKGICHAIRHIILEEREYRLDAFDAGWPPKAGERWDGVPLSFALAL